jgi:transketolase C-terminal domain/subunit
VPDVFAQAGDPSTTLDRFGMSVEHIREEAWELLRIRGKVQ